MSKAQAEEGWQELHFTCEGRSISDLCQNLMLEKNWEKALRILSKGLQGISTDQVITILKGDFVLGGENNEVSYYREENKEFKKKLAWLYAGYIKTSFLGRERWYQPYAFVSGYGPRDFHNPGAKLEVDHTSARKRFKTHPNVF